MCDGCVPARQRGPDAYLEYVRSNLEGAHHKDKVPKAFQYAQHVIEDGYDHYYVMEFYTIFETYALPWAPIKHWEMVEARMRRVLGVQTECHHGYKSHHQIGYERSYPVNRPMKDITPQRLRLAYAR